MEMNATFIIVEPEPIPVDRALEAVLEAERLREEERLSTEFLEQLLARKPGMVPLVRVV